NSAGPCAVVALGELPSAHRDPHRGEVAGGHDVVVDAQVLVLRWRIPRHIDAALLVSRAELNDLAKADRFHAWQRADTLYESAVECLTARSIVSLQAGIDTR